ncbi:PDR/VanB family oxidoreductase [Pelomonas sp. KK5]|uniref:PDR/VanB family oxidoreductase n=1 Tax=Pelomonas sp. KK5 TaxID=1855730 RepID=UPI00097BFCF6|nr:PDR/VanB family oxidoreductase [Pelomonas sp. KK5]
MTLNLIVSRRQLQGQIAVLELADPAGSPLPAFSAGAHVDLHLPGGVIRQYSLCGDPRSRASYRLGVLRDPASRGGSLAVHEALHEGARLTVSAPRNHFPLVDEASYSVLVGGGIGITPMLAMAWQLHAAGRPFELRYCARSREHAAFLDELAGAPWASHVHLHLAQRMDPIATLKAAPVGSHLYVCGPAGFMDWMLDAARSAGLGDKQLHKEHFAAPTCDTSADTAFEVIAQRSGKTVTVAANQTLLAALKTIGIKVPVSCEEGVCGTCCCTVLDGTPEHRDAYLTDEEREANDQIMVCCSRARSPRLVLDL